MKSINSEIRKALFEKGDEKNKNFMAKLIPNVLNKVILGVRTPDVRIIAKKYAKENGIEKFLEKLPHRYFDENQVHVFILSLMKDFELCIFFVECFLPYIDNWATCDQLRPSVFKKKENQKKLLHCIDFWLQGELSSGIKVKDDSYIVRFGIEMLMLHFLDDSFKSNYLKKVSLIRRENYYVKMMVAWFFATAYTKWPKETFPYFKKHVLDTWTHNKAIQKCLESFQISALEKSELKKLKISPKK